MSVQASKNELFQKLKPRCDVLFQTAVKADGGLDSDRALLAATNNLRTILLQHCQRKDGAFDEKLADYVFLPLSYTLKASQRRLGQVAEAATQCLQVLLEYGWRLSIGTQLSHQLLILLTLFAGGGQTTAPISEELKLEALKALRLLFDDIRHSPKAAGSLSELSIIPAVGECISTILEAIKKGETPSIQNEALCALKSSWTCIKDQQALSTFLPATVSSLTAALLPSTKMPRANATLVLGLQTMRLVLTSVLGDMKVANLRDEVPEKDIKIKGGAPLTKSWLKASAGQIKVAFGTVIKLRNHKSPEVLVELETLCLTLLDECHTSLEEAASMLVETAMICSSASQETRELSARTSLQDLAVIHPSIGDLVKTTAYNWATSLPRIMQSSDEDAKAAALRNLSAASDLIQDMISTSDVLTDTIVSCLKEAAMSTLETKQNDSGIQVAESNDTQNLALTIGSENVALKEYSPLLLAHESQRTTRDQFQNLLSHVGSQDMQLKMASNLLEQLPYSSGRELVSSFWLSFQLLKSAATKSNDLDTFFSTSVTASEEVNTAMNEMYDYALTTLSEADTNDEDWRTLAIALEVVAYTSSQQKDSFRPALVDALYPIVELLGSTNQFLRSHAITTLNLVSASCGYESTSAMIVQNVDYLVNAVSLKLNTFNISPQAPQVLVMMIKLSGPSLLPYLDDVVASIFAALDNFHGYHRLVDSLFAVLGEIVREGAKSDQLKVESGKEIDHRKRAPKPTSMEDLLEMLSKMKKQAPIEEESLEHEEFPQKPWKSAKTLLDEADAFNAGETAEDEPESSTEVAAIPPTKTQTLLSTIATHTQNHLTSPSPPLRLHLLTLLSLASPSLSHNQDSFLPLIHTLYPVILRRLYDPEPYVVIAAAGALASLCRGGGDFMGTRIATSWPEMVGLVKKSKKKAEEERRSKNGRGKHAVSWQVWEAMISLLVTVLKYVRVEDGVVDDCFEILQDYMGREDVREALEVVNEDLVWLMDLKAGRVEIPKMPVLEGWTFAEVVV